MGFFDKPTKDGENFSLLEDYFNVYVESFMKIFLKNFHAHAKREKKLYQDACAILYCAASKTRDNFREVLDFLYPDSLPGVADLRASLLALNAFCNGSFHESNVATTLFSSSSDRDSKPIQEKYGKHLGELVKNFLFEQLAGEEIELKLKRWIDKLEDEIQSLQKRLSLGG